MMSQITLYLMIIFENISYWFTQVFSALGATGYFIGAIALSLIVRFLISPITGRGSDRASSKKNQKEDTE